MSRRRAFGSRPRLRARRRRSDAGTDFGSASRSTGRVSTAASVSETVSPSNNRWPASISNRTTPNAQMSARLSTGLPRACSGLMYAAVPRIMPIAVPALVIVGRIVGAEVGPEAVESPTTALARPKSRTFTEPSGVILMFAGLRSRWTIPRSCAYSSPAAIWRAMSAASEKGTLPFSSRCERSSPGTSSIARKRTPPTSWKP